MSDLKQTAMQQLIDLCEEFKAEFTESDAMSFATKATYSAVINSAKELLPIEREQNDQQSIEFAEWKDSRFERYANGYKPNAQGKISGFEDRFYTINELLQIFKDKDK